MGWLNDVLYTKRNQKGGNDIDEIRVFDSLMLRFRGWMGLKDGWFWIIEFTTSSNLGLSSSLGQAGRLGPVFTRGKTKVGRVRLTWKYVTTFEKDNLIEPKRHFIRWKWSSGLARSGPSSLAVRSGLCPDQNGNFNFLEE